ncbi:MAG: hypothetical protein AAF385_02245, partial [Pseudomonadota bacterium]
KQGVGPNTRHGPPLNAGETIVLVVDQEMKSAGGTALGREYRATYSVGSTERRPVTPSAWKLTLPRNKTIDGLIITFDRLMDTEVSSQSIRVKTLEGGFIEGAVECDGRIWTFVPTEPWTSADYELAIYPTLEDLSGNRIYASFDKPADANVKSKGVASLPFRALVE